VDRGEIIVETIMAGPRQLSLHQHIACVTSHRIAEGQRKGNSQKAKDSEGSISGGRAFERLLAIGVVSVCRLVISTVR
jgi:hypothetical protein